MTLEKLFSETTKVEEEVKPFVGNNFHLTTELQTKVLDQLNRHSIAEIVQSVRQSRTRLSIPKRSAFHSVGV